MGKEEGKTGKKRGGKGREGKRRGRGDMTMGFSLTKVNFLVTSVTQHACRSFSQIG